MSTRNRHPRRGLAHETPGTIDYPWDVDPQTDEGPRSDVTCAVAWRADGFEAIEVFADPALRDRTEEICRTVEGLAGAHRDVDALNDALQEFGRGQHLSVAVHQPGRDALSHGVLAVAISPG